MAKTITCVNCGGSGHVYRIGYDGMKYPIVCPACNGTGSQSVLAR